MKKRKAWFGVAFFFRLVLPAFSQDTPEEAAARLHDVIHEIVSASPGTLIQRSLGTYASMVKARDAKALQPAAAQDDGQAEVRERGFHAASTLSLLDIIRFQRESVDLNLVQPTSRITLGAGYSESRLSMRDRTIFNSTEKYLFLKVQLSKPKGHHRVIVPFPPTATYTDIEVSPNNRVVVEEHDKGFKELRP